MNHPRRLSLAQLCSEVALFSESSPLIRVLANLTISLISSFIIISIQLKKHLLEAFNCTAAEVIELEARLQYAVTMDRLYDQLRGMETQVQSQADTPTTDERQCKYWNSQVLENYNCNRGNNEDVPAGVTMRDNDYVTNLYQDSCNCCSRHGPICFIRE